ncbi:MAG: 50S ribosomal protein L21 [bacterium]
MFVVVDYKGHQYITKEGDTLTVDLVKAEVGSDVNIEKILLSFDDAGTKVVVGKPYLKGKVVAEVVKHQQGEKVRTIKFKRKNRYQRTL